MAGDWIKMRVNLWDDPRVSRLCDMTDQGEAAIIGALYWLWSTADQHSTDGIMPGLTLRGIDRKTGVAGFAQALCDIGWLADHPDGVRVLKFHEHNGQSAKRRCLDAQRKANARDVSASDADKDGTDCGQYEDEKRRDAELDTDTDTEKRREEIEANNASHCLSPAAPETCPHQDIIAIYHEVLPMLPKVREWTPARQALLRSRWRESDKRQSLDWWRRYFTFVRDKCPFLVGKSEQPGRGPFLADLEWLIRPTNMPKVIEGRYQDRTNAA